MRSSIASVSNLWSEESEDNRGGGGGGEHSHSAQGEGGGGSLDNVIHSRKPVQGHGDTCMHFNSRGDGGGGAY